MFSRKRSKKFKLMLLNNDKFVYNIRYVLKCYIIIFKQ